MSGAAHATITVQRQPLANNTIQQILRKMGRNVQTAMKGLRRREIGGTARGNEKQNAKRETGASRDMIGHDVRGIRDLSLGGIRKLGQVKLQIIIIINNK